MSLNKNIISYTDKEIINISSNKIKIAKSSRDIKEFIKQELNKKSSNSKLYLGKINDITSNRIKILTGLDLL